MSDRCHYTFWICLSCGRVLGEPGLCAGPRKHTPQRLARWKPTKDIQAAADAAYILGGYDAVTALYRETR